ncbi:hypothetical protein L9F63_000764 [Diploptera punctata]|uniref:Uncharacterized protein n=1 Tax=Diploptera punctata TaxID=6984 RepID=A0AAD8AKW3_DIPPU|nr:hypothetical protein L9F63_000764 [Diploptera punctata]
MYRFASGSATESSRLLVPEPVGAPADFYNSAPARLDNDGHLNCYNSITPSETATEATSYHGISASDSISRQNSLETEAKEDDLLIDFSPGTDESKNNGKSNSA